MLSVRVRCLATLVVLALAWSAASLAQNTAPQNSAKESFQSLVQSANAARDSGNAAEAIHDYTQAVTLHPDWAEGWWNLGILQYENNHYADAVTTLRKLIALAPNSAAGWSILGLSEFETRDYTSALASLQKARELGGISDPDIAHVSAYHLGMLLVRSGNFAVATSLLRSDFGSSPPAQVKTLLGLALLHVPLLPSEVDPSQDALVQSAGDATTRSDPTSALTALVLQYPKTPWLHYAYGLALASAGQSQAALDQLKIETKLSPASPLPWTEISHLNQQLGHKQQAITAAHKASQLTLASPARSPRVIALYGTHGASISTSEGAAQWQAAMQDYAQGRYSQAITMLKNWVEQHPTDGTSWAVLGLSEYALKDYANARIHLQRGISLGVEASPQSVALARGRLALLLICNHQFDAASSLLKPIASQSSMADQIQIALGLALLRMPLLPSQLTPQQHSLAQSAGAVLQMLFASRYEQAFGEFKKLIAQHPTTPWLHYAYGDALDSLSQYDKAKAQMHAEMKLSPHSPLPWIRVAAISVRQHQSAEAVSAAQTAVHIAPDSAEAHYQLGRAWLESGDAQKAIAELLKANSLRSNNLEIHFALARAYAKAGFAQKAAAERATFMQLKSLAASSQPSTAAQSILQLNSQPPQD
jgi:tetratricopeptide (TPR) repeat protein